MTRWKTIEISDLVKSLTGIVPDVEPQFAGEHFTDELSFDVDGDFLMLGGFVEDGEFTDPSDEDVEYVYLHDQSGEGLKSRSKKVRAIF